MTEDEDVRVCGTCLRKKPESQFLPGETDCITCSPEGTPARKLLPPKPPRVQIDGDRQCKKCYKTSPASTFWQDPASIDGLSRYCPECAQMIDQKKREDSSKAYRKSIAHKVTHRCRDDLKPTKKQKISDRLMRDYGINLKERNDLYKAQGGVCAICKKNETAKVATFSRRIKKLSVDHNHRTEQVRGLLCGKCNRAIGLFGDSIETLENAVAYLRTPPGRHLPNRKAAQRKRNQKGRPIQPKA